MQSQNLANFVRQYWFVVPAVYLVIGAAIGATIRYLLDRHLWVKHKLSKRVESRMNEKYKETEECICEYHRMGWDFFEFMSYASFALWPFVFAIMAAAIPICIYAKVLELVSRIARREPKPKFTGVSGAVGYGRVDTSPAAVQMLQDQRNFWQRECDRAMAKTLELTKALEEGKLKPPDLETTVEEEFKKRTGRELGEDVIRGG